MRLWLEYGEDGTRISLSHVEEGYIIPREAINLPPGEGVVVVSVNGHEHRRVVSLDEGMSEKDREVRVRPRDAVPF